MIGNNGLVVDLGALNALITHARCDAILVHRSQHSSVVQPSHAGGNHGEVAPQVLLVSEEVGYIVYVLRKLRGSQSVSSGGVVGVEVPSSGARTRVVPSMGEVVELINKLHCFVVQIVDGGALEIVGVVNTSKVRGPLDSDV